MALAPTRVQRRRPRVFGQTFDAVRHNNTHARSVSDRPTCAVRVARVILEPRASSHEHRIVITRVFARRFRTIPRHSFVPVARRVRNRARFVLGRRGWYVYMVCWLDTFIWKFWWFINSRNEKNVLSDTSIWYRYRMDVRGCAHSGATATNAPSPPPATLSHDPLEAPYTAPVPRARLSARAPAEPPLRRFLANPAS